MIGTNVQWKVGEIKIEYVCVNFAYDINIKSINNFFKYNVIKAFKSYTDTH